MKGDTVVGTVQISEADQKSSFYQIHQGLSGIAKWRNGGSLCISPFLHDLNCY
jgi:hypothetical protein